MRLEKSRQILKLVLLAQASPEGVGLQDIQDVFETGRRTAERMRDVLLQLFPHVEEIRIDGKTKRWRLPASSINGLLQASVEELACMKTAIDLLRKEHLAHYADSLENLWLKVKGRLRPESVSMIETDLEALLEAEGHAMRPRSRPVISPQVLHLLREAIKGFSKVKFTYFNRTDNAISERFVHPYGLVYGEYHNLVAWCEQLQGICSFRLASITDIILIDVHYRKDPSFDIRDYARRSFGVCQEEPYEVLWRFSPKVAARVQDYHFHPTQRMETQPDGSIMVRFTAGSWKEMCWHVMTWEGHAEILEPPHLRESYKQMVERLHKCVSAGK